MFNRDGEFIEGREIMQLQSKEKSNLVTHKTGKGSQQKC